MAVKMDGRKFNKLRYIVGGPVWLRTSAGIHNLLARRSNPCGTPKGEN